MKIGIIHFRVGLTDGVSLEIEKRKLILQQMGHSVKLISSEVNEGADYVIENFDYDSILMNKIKKEAYIGLEYYSENDLMDTIYHEASKYTNALDHINQIEKFDFFLVHNVFSLGSNLPSAKGVYDFLKVNDLPSIFFHHDFYFEKPFYTYPNKSINSYLNQYLPPIDNKFSHLTINTISQNKLKVIKNIDAEVIADVFDFTQPQWEVNDFNKTFLGDIGVDENDLIVMMATRIIKRKGFELAFQVASELQNQIQKIQGNTLYNGKRINNDTKVCFIISGHPESSEYEYYLEMQKLASSYTNFKTVFISDRIGYKESLDVNGNKIYSLWDAYVFCDLILYTTMYEGWGNQLIEAFFAQKPVIINAYEVFKTDVKKEGYILYELGETVVKDNYHKFISIDHDEIVKCVNLLYKDIIDSHFMNNNLLCNYNIAHQKHDLDTFIDYFQKQFDRLMVNDQMLDNNLELTLD